MTRILSFVVLFAIALFPIHTQAAAPPDDVAPPKTKLEKLSIKTGVVIIRGFDKIGALQGQFGTSVSVDAKEFINVSTGSKEYGITIKIKEEKGRFDKERTSYIDYNEIDSLLNGISYISKVNKSVTKFSNFQADYKTIGEFRISTFSTAKGTMVAVSSGNISSASAYYSFADLSKIKHLIEEARAKLDTIKK